MTDSRPDPSRYELVYPPPRPPRRSHLPAGLARVLRNRKMVPLGLLVVAAVAFGSSALIGWVRYQPLREGMATRRLEPPCVRAVATDYSCWTKGAPIQLGWSISNDGRHEVGVLSIRVTNPSLRGIPLLLRDMVIRGHEDPYEGPFRPFTLDAFDQWFVELVGRSSVDCTAARGVWVRPSFEITYRARGLTHTTIVESRSDELLFPAPEFCR